MPLSDFSGPRGHWLLGSINQLKSQNVDFFTEIFSKYGKYARIRLGPIKVLVIADNKTAHNILVRSPENFAKKNPAWQELKALLGDSILLAHDAQWKRKRKLYAPSFHPQAIENYCGIMQSLAHNYATSISDGCVRDMQKDFANLTANIVSKCLFHKNPQTNPSNIFDNLDEIADMLLEQRLNPIRLPKWLPTAKNLKIAHSIRAIEAIIYNYLDEEMRSNQPNDSLLSLLVHSTDQYGKRLTRKELRDETLTLYLAGHETTALTLTWALYELTRHPQILQRAQSEVDDILQDEQFQFHHFPKLSFLKNIVNETLRLYPPASFIPRQTREKFIIAGKTLPKKTNLLISVYAMHRDPDYFEDPLSFRPTRWDNQLEKKLPKCQFLPFGAGPRICVGSAFAMVEAVAVLATLLQQFDLCQPYAYTRHPIQRITLRLSGGLPIKFSRRSSVKYKTSVT